MSRPPLFVDLGLDSALERGKSERKLVLVDASAAWCQPCKLMDRTTWVDPKVVARLGECAVALQVDVDAEPDVAKRLRVRAVPTIVAFRDGAEIDRIMGERNPGALLEWVEALASGRTSLDLARDAAKEPTAIQERISLLNALVEANQLDEATELAVWVWEHMLEHAPDMLAMRHTFFLGTLKQLVGAHPPAAVALSRVRDAIVLGGEGEAREHALHDWISLSDLLGDEDRVLAWFDGAVDTFTSDPKFAEIVQSRVVPWLAERDRWRDVGRAHPAPLEVVRHMLDEAQKIRDLPNQPDAIRDQIRIMVRNMIRGRSYTIVRGLFAEGRADDARACVEAVRAADASPEIADALERAERGEALPTPKA